MNQSVAEAELERRIFQWARERINHEVADGFPLIGLFRHARRIECQLAWMTEMTANERLQVCLSLVACANRPVRGSPGASSGVDDEAIDLAEAAYSRFHHTLPPNPDFDRNSVNFAKGDLERCRDLIIGMVLESLGNPSKRFPKTIWYVRRHDEWLHKCVIELRSPYGSGMVECRNFLWRDDFKFDSQSDDSIRNINVLGKLGFGIWGLPVVSRNQEVLSAKAVAVLASVFSHAVPSLVVGLGTKD